MKIDIKKYIIAFLITSAIFFTAIFISNYFSEKKLNSLKSAENKISIDILSSETQFAILGELSCEVSENPTLSTELDSLGDKLNYSEEKFGSDDPEFISLKKYYTLLEIKNYLLLKKLKGCPKPPVVVLYFYANSCVGCDKEGYVLTYLRQKYPDLRVYSFDLDLDLPALKTLASVHKIGDNLPALVIHEKTYTGFKNIDEIKKLLPELHPEVDSKK